MRSPWKQLCLLSLALVLPFVGARASNEIPEGTDCWHTKSPGTQATFTLLPDALGAGSAARRVTIDLQSLPLTPEVVKTKCGCQVDTKIEYIDPHGNVSTERTVHAVQQRTTETTDVDTCVHRQANTKFQGKGRAVKVDIQLVKLSLQSVKPLVVSYRGGATKSFNVKVTESGPQETGSMTFTPRTLGALSMGEVRLDRLKVTYDLTFTEVPPGTSTFTLTGQRLQLKNGARAGRFEQLHAR
jgi:hypothetical protein